VRPERSGPKTSATAVDAIRFLSANVALGAGPRRERRAPRDDGRRRQLLERLEALGVRDEILRAGREREEIRVREIDPRRHEDERRAEAFEARAQAPTLPGL
jgi:hypothetical protein